MKNKTPKEQHQSKLKILSISDIFINNFKSYGAYTLKHRALPDIRDGLKPINRKILYAMDQANFASNLAYKKSAAMVGEVIGKYHPHGDSSIYQASVVMVQKFNNNAPTIDGHGAFGTIDGDGAAAARYCVIGDTMIQTTNGSMSIKSIYDKFKTSNNQSEIDLKADDLYVYNLFGNPTPVSKIFNCGVHDLYKVKFNDGTKLVGTPNHPILVADEYYRDIFKWKRLDEIERNDVVIGICNSRKNSQSLCSVSSFLIPSYIEITNHIINKDGSFSKERLFSNRNVLITTRRNVVKIEKLKRQERVYSLKVDSKCHSFITNGIISHNTEQRLSKFAEDVLLYDLDPSVVEFKPNFDGRFKEPSVLPAKVPFILLNGIVGIATGFATNIPPHNLSEVLTGCQEFVKNRSMSYKDMMKYIPAPDFPTGGIINGSGTLPGMYASGIGGVKLRGKIRTEQDKKGRWVITIYEVPYGTKPSDIMNQVLLLHQMEVFKVDECLNLADKFNKVKIEIVFNKSEQDVKRLEGLLYSRTLLETRISSNFLALVDGKPTKVNLLESIRHFVKFRESVLYKKHNNELDKNNKRIHILEGLLKVMPIIDDIILIVRKSSNGQEAADKMIKKYNLTPEQTEYILKLQLMKLTRLEMEDTKEEHKKLKDRNKVLTTTFLTNNGSNKHVDELMTKEWEDIKKKFGRPRMTEIKNDTEVIDTTRLLKAIPCMIITTKKGYIKRLPLTQADMVQGRNGKGRNIPGLDLDDEVKDIIDCDTTTELTLVSSAGKVYNKLAYDIPETKGLGSKITYLFDLGRRETCVLFTAFSTDIERVMLVLENGDVKVSRISDLRGNIKVGTDGKASKSKKGYRLMKMEVNDKLVAAVGLTMKPGDKGAIIATANGKAIRLSANEIRVSSNAAGGIKGMTMDGDDYVTSACGTSSTHLTIVTSSGFAKKIETDSIRMTARGGKGVRIGSHSDDGKILYIGDKAEGLLTITTSSNKMLTFDLECLRETGKTSKGVKVANLTKDEYVTQVN